MRDGLHHLIGYEDLCPDPSQLNAPPSFGKWIYMRRAPLSVCLCGVYALLFRFSRPQFSADHALPSEECRICDPLATSITLYVSQLHYAAAIFSQSRSISNLTD